MIKILFICHGNICRSPMAEFVMKDLVNKRGIDNKIFIASAATTNEEIGNDIHPGTQRELAKQGIPFTSRQARKLTKSDYNEYDLLIAMDEENMIDIPLIVGKDIRHKVHLLMSYCGEERDVADPWYTRNFHKTYEDIYRGCQALLSKILNDI